MSDKVGHPSKVQLVNHAILSLHRHMVATGWAIAPNRRTGPAVTILWRPNPIYVDVVGPADIVDDLPTEYADTPVADWVTKNQHLLPPGCDAMRMVIGDDGIRATRIRNYRRVTDKPPHHNKPHHNV